VSYLLALDLFQKLPGFMSLYIRMKGSIFFLKKYSLNTCAVSKKVFTLPMSKGHNVVILKTKNHAYFEKNRYPIK
jgi:hypothetical protein